MIVPLQAPMSCTFAELPVRAPLKAALTGLELLLARAQLWEETAASHVSLQGMLRPVAGLAGRWRKLELASWKGLLHRTVAGFAEGESRVADAETALLQAHGLQWTPACCA